MASHTEPMNEPTVPVADPAHEGYAQQDELVELTTEVTEAAEASAPVTGVTTAGATTSDTPEANTPEASELEVSELEVSTLEASTPEASANDQAATRPTHTRKGTASAAGAKKEVDRAIQKKKDAVRREVLGRRQELRPAARSSKSRDICNQLLDKLKSSGIKGRNGEPPTIAVYAALRFEIDLDRFIRGAYAYGYRIVFPCMIPNESTAGAICMRSVSCNNYLGGNVPFIVDPRRAWGPAVTEEHQTYTSTRAGATRRFIPSRAKGSVPPKDDTRFPVVPPREIDLAVIPAIAFDAQGNRLGYGRGSYDRYLPQLRSDCKLIGIAFAEQEVDAVPVEPHDIALPEFVTA